MALIGVAQDGSASLVKLFADAAAASPAAALAAASSSSGAGLLALASSAEDGSSIRLQLADASSGEVVEAAEVAVPPPAYPTAGLPAHVVGVWLDASKRKQQASSSSSTLAGCRLLVLWSDDRLSFIERGEEAWAREEALAAGTSSLMVDLPAARADQASDADADADSASTAAAGSKKGGGVLGLLQDKDAFKQWVRLQVLSVLIQFKLNTDPEREEFLQLRQALRCGGGWGWHVAWRAACCVAALGCCPAHESTLLACAHCVLHTAARTPPPTHHATRAATTTCPSATPMASASSSCC